MNIPQNVEGTTQLSCCNSRAGAPYAASPEKEAWVQTCTHASFSLRGGAAWLQEGIKGNKNDRSIEKSRFCDIPYRLSF
jgi:hypothetical protein